MSTYFKFKEKEVFDINYNELVGHVLFTIMLHNSNTIGINSNNLIPILRVTDGLCYYANNNDYIGMEELQCAKQESKRAKSILFM